MNPDPTTNGAHNITDAATLARLLAERDAECAALRDQLRALTEEREALKQRTREAEELSESYRLTLQRELPIEVWDVTKQELDDMLKNGFDLKDTIREIEEMGRN